MSDVSVAEARQQMDAMADMFHRMTDQCFRKCVQGVNDSDLSKGEGTCVERCVTKYVEVHTKVGGRLATIQSSAML